MKLFSLKSLLPVATLFAALTASAGTYEFSYNTPGAEYGLLGYGVAEHHDVCMYIPGTGLTDMDARLQSLRFVVPMSDGLRNFRVWVSEHLYDPGWGAAFSGDVKNGFVTRVAEEGNTGYGSISYTLAEPYAITANGVYVGYSFDVMDTNSNWTKYPMVVTEDTAVGATISRTSINYTTWGEQRGFALVGSVTFEGDFVDNAATVSCETLYLENSKADNLVATIINQSATPITSVDYAYAIGEYSGTGSVDVEVAGVIGAETSVVLPIDAVDVSGAYDSTLTITKVNGQNNGSQNPACTFRTKVLDFKPKHRPVVEEYSGTWCPNCIRGFGGMEFLRDTFDDFIGISFHGRDIMELKSGNPAQCTGYPQAFIDRNPSLPCDPYFGSPAMMGYAIPGYIAYDYQAAAAVFAPADINVSAEWNDADDALLIDSEVIFADLPDDGFNYRVSYVVVEDGLTGTTSDWTQQNGLNEESGVKGDKYLGKYVGAGAELPGFVYDDVAVYATAVKGVSNSLPRYSELELNTPYTHRHEAKLKDFVTKRNKQSYQNRGHMRVVALLIRQDSDLGTIVNAAQAAVPAPSAVEGIAADNEVVSTECFDLNGRRVANPANGIYIERRTLSNGTIETLKVIR